jgi:protein SCO1/2
MIRTLQVAGSVVLGLALAFWLLRPVEGPDTTSPDPSREYFLPEPLTAPTFELLSHTGEAVSSESFPGKLLVVFFGYTSCPDVCPLTLSKLGQAFREMGETGERVQVVLVSVDPGRDSPARLASYLSNFHPSFLGLTGSEEEVRKVADGFGAYFARQGEGEGYTVDHTARAFVVHPDGTIPLTFPVTATPGEMARDLTTLLEETP